MRKYNTKLYPSIANRIYQRILWILEWWGNWLINGIRYHFTHVNQKKSVSYKGDKHNLVIIANGPSIVMSMKQILAYKDCDFACMNYFPIKSDYFDKLQPKFMFATDVMFFDKDYKNLEPKKNTILLKKKLKNVDWDMTLFVREGGSFELSNKHMKEIRVNMTQIGGVYSKFRGWLFDRGIAMPITATVAAAAILYGIKMGYKCIYVYGIDQSTHENMKVDKRNRTVADYKHFYKENDSKENVLDYDIGSIFWDSYRSIIGYRMLEKYAAARGCKVYNCTPGSYVDAFERRLEDGM